MTPRPPRLFAWLLRAFPARFRGAYADDMAATFADRLAAARRSGTRAVIGLWARTTASVVVQGLAERRRSSFLHRTPATAVPGVSRGASMTGWIQDLRYAMRRLGREPAYAVFVAATLALGIAANVTVFSVVNGVLLKALPYDHSERLVAVWSRFVPESGLDFPQFPLSKPEYVDYRAETKTMSDVGAWESGSLALGGRGDVPERVTVTAATPSLFHVLRASAARGRVFTDADRSGPGGVVILSSALWQGRFGARAEIIGQSIMVDGTSRRVIGVMPRGFEFPAGTALWTPLVVDPANPGNRQSHYIEAVARLADGATYQAAEREMDVLMRGWRQRFPKIHTGHFLYLTPLLDDTVGPVGTILRVLLVATACLLVIVCANVASLVLARAERHAREAAIRTALGSGRWRLVRLAILEHGVLALAGGALGTSMAAFAVARLPHVEGIGLPRLSEIRMDPRVWLFAVTVSVATAILLGVIPTLGARTRRIASALRLDARTASPRGRTWLRRSLVTMEVALAVVLAVGAALMTQSFRRLVAVDTGVRSDHVLLASLELPRPAYADDGRVTAFWDAALDHARRLAGVNRAALSTNVPLVSSLGVWDFEIEGRATPGPGRPGWNAPPAFVSPGYLEAIGVRLVRGRFFSTADSRQAEPVAVVTEAFARTFFGGTDPLGQRIRVSGDAGNRYARIVGLAGDLRDQSLDKVPRPMYFLALAQMPETEGGVARQCTFVLRTAGDPAALAAPLRAAIRDLDPSLPLYGVRTYDAAMAETVARRRLTTLLLAVFAAFGLAIGLLGIYGVLAYTVAERTQELGLRRALGAPTPRLVRFVLTQGLTPVVIGIVAGLVAARAAHGVIRAQLFGISSTDGVTYLMVTAGVLAAAVVACLVPAGRALRISPLTALRDQAP